MIAFCITIALSAELLLWISKLDVSNAFQCSILKPTSEVYTTLPLFYLEWFQHRFPNILLPTEKS